MMIRLVDEAFDAGAALTRFSAGRTVTGAVASFLGLARGEPGQAVVLELEAYPGFTETRIATIVETAIDRFGLQDAQVIHRIGPIPPGDPIVLVLTAAAHRREAFEACDFLMDYLKSRAPFWKKEYGPDGPRWVEPTAQDLSDLERWRTAEHT
jgi:molybdopterin synthase catalytic subunit